MTVETCKARVIGDQKRCDRCGLLWDLNDPEPPECLTDTQIDRQRGRMHLRKIRNILESQGLDR